MRIAQVVGFMDTVGGVPSMVRTLSRELARRGHETCVVYWDGRPSAEMRALGNLRKVDIFGLSRRPLAGNIVRKLGRLTLGRHVYPWSGARFFTPRLARLLADCDAAAFHGRHYYGFHRWRGPHVYVSHGCPPAGWRYPNIFKGRTILAVSEFVRREMIAQFDLRPDDIRCVYNAIDIEQVRARAEAPAALPTQKPYIVAVGRLAPIKRFDVLLRAYALAGLDEDLVLVGDGRERKRLEKLRDELGLAGRVHFVGAQANPYPFVKNARLLALSSDYEALSIVLIEALALGTPAAATACPGPREVLTGELARGLAPVGDAPALARAMRGILAAPPRIDAAALRRFDAREVAAQWLACLEEVVAGRRARADVGVGSGV